MFVIKGQGKVLKTRKGKEMDGHYHDRSWEGCEKVWPQQDYSSPLYTLSLIKKEAMYLNNLIEALETQLKDKAKS